MKQCLPLSLPAAAIVLLVSPAALGQSYHLWSGSLTYDGEQVAEASYLPVEVTWQAPIRATVLYEDESIRVTGSIVTKGSGDYLMAGVGEEVRLKRTGGWKITMLPGSWAPVLGGNETSVQIALPEHFPVKKGRIEAGACAAVSRPYAAPHDYDEDYTVEATAGEPVLSITDNDFCVDRIYRQENDEAYWRHSYCEGDYRLLGISKAGRWGRVKIYLEGYAVEGFMKTSPCEMIECPYLGAIGGGSSCADGMSYGRDVRLESGTALYPSKDSTAGHSFALVKKPLEALELYDTIIPDRQDDPDATPSSSFTLEYSKGYAFIILFGFLKVPFKKLVDVDPDDPYPGGLFGICRDYPEGWPSS